MFSIFKKSQGIIRDMEAFFDAIDQASIIFQEGVGHYVNQNSERFALALTKIRALEEEADKLKERSSSALYTHSLLPDFRGDILRLMENMDDLIDTMKHNLVQLDVERPDLHERIKADFADLARLSSLSVQEVVQAARTFFREPTAVRDKIARVNLYEDEADILAENIKRNIYQNIPDLSLSSKIHLRYFTLHIETVSDLAESVGEKLGIMAIKRFS